MVTRSSMTQVDKKSDVEQQAPGWQLLKARDFSWLFWGQMTSQVGDSLNRVALLWFVYQLTGSAMRMVVIGLLQTIPPLVLGPLIGVYLDIANKKTVMVWVDVGRTVLDVLCHIVLDMRCIVF